MNRFYITGLPRSRTSWMALVFQAHGYFCWHEAMNDCKIKEDFIGKMSIAPIIGDSDCGLPYCDVLDMVPGPMVIIEREPKEVQRSLQALGFTVSNDRLDLMVAMLESLDGLRVPFKNLDSRMKEIFQHCVQNDPNDLKLLMMQNIKAEPRTIVNTSQCWRLP